MERIKEYDTLFQGCEDLVSKSFFRGEKRKLEIYVMYVDGLADHQMVEDFVLRPLITAEQFKSKEEIENMLIEVADYKWLETVEDVSREVLSGNTVILIDTILEALMISTKNFPNRSVSSPETEATMRGPKDGFVENLRTNTALIRRRIRDPKLKVKQMHFGTRSKTSIAILYIDDLVEPKVLDDCLNRFEKYEIDGVFDSGMLEQLLVGDWNSIFPQYQHTERPDKAASGLMEGRVVVVMDTAPEVLLLPATMNTFFQAADDYYCHNLIAIFARVLRYFAAFLAIALPGLYVAVTGFHSEILPMNFLKTLVEARNHVAVPVVVEIIMMEIAFELLREAGIRIPGQMGNTIGVVGGLIVGQAAVDAGLVSTIVVIVVSLTAIASFSIPNEAFTSAFRLLKFLVLIFSAIWGIYGFFLSMLYILQHLTSLNSFGVPYLQPAVAGSISKEDKKDFVLKAPILNLRRRPSFSGSNKTRLCEKGALKGGK